MDIEISKSVTNAYVYRHLGWRCFIIGTHNKFFHSDDVVACAMLCLLHEKRKIEIVRTRDEQILQECNICVDIGGGAFDHHMPDFNKVRENKIPYARAGLVWKRFGKDLLYKYGTRYSEFALDYIPELHKRFDDEIISLVDAEDNGKLCDKHCFSFISSFLPIWNEANPDFDGQFLKALKITIKVLENEIVQLISQRLAKDELKNRWKDIKYFSNNILEIPSQTVPWLETTVEINKVASLEKTINFVIFEYPDGGWASQCVPPSMEQKFEQRIPFPRGWAGRTNEELARISNVEGAIRCHNLCFFARAKTKEGIIKMCEIAMGK